MKLSQVIRIWDELHTKDSGDLDYGDLERALENASVEIIDDTPPAQPIKTPLCVNCGAYVLTPPTCYVGRGDSSPLMGYCLNHQIPTSGISPAPDCWYKRKYK